MRILIAGATGFIGKKLGLHLAEQGHQILVLARNPDRAHSSLPFPCEIFSWDPLRENRNHILKDLIKGCDVVINLAGENIAEQKWTKQRLKDLTESRTNSVRILHDLIEQLPNHKPKVFICATAIGFYGDRGDEILDENAALGSGYLANICKAWEREVFSHRLSETRVIALRLGMVLGREGGALPKLLDIFKIVGASPLGTGKQWMSWIHYKDLLQVIDHCIRQNIDGVVNAVAPEAATNEQFTRILASRLGVWNLPKVPKILIKFLLRNLSELVLSSQKVVPQKLLESGFEFKYKNLDAALYSLTYNVELGRGTFAQELSYDQFFPVSTDHVWNKIVHIGSLSSLVPPEYKFEVQSVSAKELADSVTLNYSFSLFGREWKWQTKVLDFKPITSFTDMQMKGPFSLWYHHHEFIPLQKGCVMRDKIIFRIPGSYIGNLLLGPLVRSKIEGIFSYRKRILEKELS